MPRSRTPKAARPRCSRCDRPIHVPKGWSHGPAIRRHYWRKHREVMQPELGRRTR